MIHAPIKAQKQSLPKSPAKSRLKLNPQRGRMPVLQYCAPGELRIDPAYQRDTANGASQTLIRRIASDWNWDLCQPLIVSRRRLFGADQLFVVDGQHRLEAARLRADISQLPCVVTSYVNADQEAANFVALNQARKPLSALDLFKANVAGGDPDATRIHDLISRSGLMLATHTNYASWKPGQIANIAGLSRAIAKYGESATGAALRILAVAWPGQVLRKAGTIFPGVAHIVAERMGPMSPDDWEASLWPELMVEMLGGGSQTEWADDIAAIKAIPGMESRNWRACAERALAQAWEEFMAALEGDD